MDKRTDKFKVGDFVVVKTMSDIKAAIARGEDYKIGTDGVNTPNGSFMNNIMLKDYQEEIFKIIALGSGTYNITMRDTAGKIVSWRWSSEMIKPAPYLPPWDDVFTEER